SSFIFQAEDGIRDFHVTGVQTCALPIYDFRGLLEVLGFPAALRVLAHDQISPAHPDEIVFVLPFRLPKGIEVGDVRYAAEAVLPSKITDLRPHHPAPLQWQEPDLLRPLRLR